MKTYKTQMEAAKQGIITPQMALVAKKESMEPEALRQLVAKGEVAIPCNIRHTSISPEGIGAGLRTKINVNLGISGDCNHYDVEMQKVDLALQFGAEAIMDLSNYGKTNTFRQAPGEGSAGEHRRRFPPGRPRPCGRGCGLYDHSRRHQPPRGGGLHAGFAENEHRLPGWLSPVCLDDDDGK